MKDWRGLVRRVMGKPLGATGIYADLALQLPRLFVLRPDEGIGKDYLLALDQLDQKIGSAPSDDEAEAAARLIYETAEVFADTQKEQIDIMFSDVAESAGELLQKLSGYVEMQSDRVSQIENIRTNISAAQSAATLDGMRELLSKSLGGLQDMVETELQRQKELRSDHENYAAKLQVRLDTVEKESRTDVLTGIANRNGCMKKIHAVLDYVKTNRAEYRLVLVDLNGFKQINDTLGHAAGDAALVAFSNRLLAAVGKENFVGRLAGDEFIVISDSSSEVIDSMLHRLQGHLVSYPASYKGIQLELSFCYGVSSITRNSDPSSIIEQADIKLYKNKNDFYSSKVA